MKHMTNAHDESRSKTVPCPQCDKMCYDQENLRKHMASHSGQWFFNIKFIKINVIISVES